MNSSTTFIFTVLSTFRTSLIAQLVKNLPAMPETLAQFLGQEDLLEKGQATYSATQQEFLVYSVH